MELKVESVSALCGGLCVISVRVCISVYTVCVSHKHSVAALQEQLRIRIPWKTAQTLNISSSLYPAQPKDRLNNSRFQSLVLFAKQPP